MSLICTYVNNGAEQTITKSNRNVCAKSTHQHKKQTWRKAQCLLQSTNASTEMAAGSISTSKKNYTTEKAPLKNMSKLLMLVINGCKCEGHRWCHQTNENTKGLKPNCPQNISCRQKGALCSVKLNNDQPPRNRIHNVSELISPSNSCIGADACCILVESATIRAAKV